MEGSSEAVSRGSRGLDRALGYLQMELGGRSMACLLDSGCEVTLMPKAVIDSMKSVHVLPSSQRLWAANGSEIEVTGETTVPMLLNGRYLETFALVSPDVEEIMLGADWLQTHNCLWDFGNGKLYIDGQTAAPLNRKRQLSCRRVYIQEASMLPPKQQVDVTARSTLRSLCTMEAEDWILESHQLRPGLYVGRTLLPSKHRDLVIRMVNTTAESQLLPSGTCLGSLYPVEVMEKTDGQPVETRDFELARNEGSMHDSTQHAYRQHAAINDGTLDTINKTSEATQPDEIFSQHTEIDNAWNMSTSTLSSLASVFAPGSAHHAASRATTNKKPADSNNDGDEVASVLAGEHLQEAQQQDADIGPVLRLRLQQTEAPQVEAMLPQSEASKIIWSQWQQLELHNGVLYRRHTIQQGRADVLQLLVPAVLKDDYMKQAHGGMCGGHLGLRRTLEQVRRRTYWVGWRRDVKRFCRQCPNCNGYFRGQLPRSAPLQPLTTGAPSERLHVNFTGSHPRSRRGSVYMSAYTPFSIAATAQRRFGLSDKQRVGLRRRLSAAAVTERRMAAEVRQLLPVGTADGNAALVAIHRLEAWVQHHEQRPPSRINE